MGRRFLIWLCLVSLAEAMAIVALNTLIDPAGYLQAREVSQIRFCTPGIRTDERRAKPPAAIAFRPQGLLIGTSQISIGFDAADASNYLGRTYNLSAPGLQIHEMRDAFERVALAAPVRTVVIGLALSLMTGTTGRGLVASDAASSSRAAGEYRFGLFSAEATRASLRSLVSAEACFAPDVRPDGTRALPDIAANAEVMNRRLLIGVAREKAVPIRSDLYQRRLSDLEEIVDLGCIRSAAVHFVLLPNHAQILEMWGQLLGDDALDQWKRDMMELAERHRGRGCTVETWDYSIFNRVTEVDFRAGAESETFPFMDITHFRPFLGRTILEDIFGGGRSGLGARLLPESVEAHLRDDRAARDSWRALNPETVSRISTLLSEEAR